MKLKSILLCLLLPFSAFGATNAFDNVKINTSLKLNFGSVSAGRVLTSDANGMAAWSNAPTAATSGITNWFPGQGTVFLDSNTNYGSSSVIIATNLCQATKEWLAGGRATALYGAPTAARPGLILVAPGTYGEQTNAIMGCPLTVRSISGNPWDTGFKLMQNAAEGFIITNGSVNVSGCMFDENAKAQSHAAFYINFTGSYTGTLDHCVFKGANGPSGVNIRITTATFDGSLVHSEIFVLGGSGGYGFLGTGNNWRILDNKWNMGTCAYGLNGPAGGVGSFGILQGNLFTGSASSAAIELSNVASTDLISGNSINNSHATGVGINCNMSKAIVANNYLFCQGKPFGAVGPVGLIGNYAVTYGSNTAGITLTANGAKILGNYIVGTGTGAAISGIQKSAFISGNMLRMTNDAAQGSSIHTSVTNLATSLKGTAGDTPNAEMPSTVTD